MARQRYPAMIAAYRRGGVWRLILNHNIGAALTRRNAMTNDGNVCNGARYCQYGRGNILSRNVA